jgi:hypothetical protein
MLSSLATVQAALRTSTVAHVSRRTRSVERRRYRRAPVRCHRTAFLSLLMAATACQPENITAGARSQCLSAARSRQPFLLGFMSVLWREYASRLWPPDITRCDLICVEHIVD